MKIKIRTFFAIILIISIQNARAFEKNEILPPVKTGTSLKDVKKKTSIPAVKKNYTPAELTKNLEYDFARSSIRTSYGEKLDQLAKYIIDNDLALSLRGYADSIGTFKGNWVISEKRAVAVKNYLVGKGVAGDKIITTPFGSTKPIATNKTLAGRQKNRRVEIKLTEIK